MSSHTGGGRLMSLSPNDTWGRGVSKIGPKVSCKQSTNYIEIVCLFDINVTLLMFVIEQGQCGISQLRLLPAEVGQATYPHNKARVTAASADRILE
jgi:hypothetical protein